MCFATQTRRYLPPGRGLGGPEEIFLRLGRNSRPEAQVGRVWRWHVLSAMGAQACSMGVYGVRWMIISVPSHLSRISFKQGNRSPNSETSREVVA